MSTIKRWWNRLWCPHYWRPVPHYFYGSHGPFDAVYNPKRAYRCSHCGKEIVTRIPPVSYIGTL